MIIDMIGAFLVKSGSTQDNAPTVVSMQIANENVFVFGRNMFAYFKWIHPIRAIQIQIKTEVNILDKAAS